jgi:hypothetical protein
MGQSTAPGANGSVLAKGYANVANVPPSGDTDLASGVDATGDLLDSSARGWESLWIDIGGEG